MTIVTAAVSDSGIVGWFFPLYFLALWSFVMFAISRTSGWSQLADLYRTSAELPAERFRFVQTYFRWMTHSNVVTYAANSEGLFMKNWYPFSLFMPGLFIPWSDFEVSKREGIFWNKYEFRFQKCDGVFIRIPENVALPLLDHAPQNSSLIAR
jgi:hypothetical protein